MCSSCHGCIKPTCTPGFYGDKCDLPCDPNCRILACPSCACDVCNKSLGVCLNGCDAGWYGDTCKEVCPTNCFRERLIAVQCEQFTGTCMYGCQMGYFGERCNVTCADHCLKSVCEQVTGQCSLGCLHGFEGDYCNEEAEGFGTDQIAGAVGGAFVVVLWGIVVIVLICVIWRRRQKDYEVFNRNHILHHRRSRGSSRRRLHRENSNSSNSACVMLPPGGDCRHGHEGRIQETTIGDSYLERAMTYKVDTPVHSDIVTSHTSEGEEVEIHPDVSEVTFGQMFVPDENNKRNGSSVTFEGEEDIGELDEIWRVRML